MAIFDIITICHDISFIKYYIFKILMRLPSLVYSTSFFACRVASSTCFPSQQYPDLIRGSTRKKQLAVAAWRFLPAKENNTTVNTLEDRNSSVHVCKATVKEDIRCTMKELFHTYKLSFEFQGCRAPVSSFVAYNENRAYKLSGWEALSAACKVHYPWKMWWFKVEGWV